MAPTARVVREGLLPGPRRVRDGLGQGDQERVPEAVAPVPPRRQRGRRRGRGAVQGDVGRLRRGRRRGAPQGVRRGPPARARRPPASPAAAAVRAGSRFQDGGDLGDLLGGLFGRGGAAAAGRGGAGPHRGPGPRDRAAPHLRRRRRRAHHRRSTSPATRRATPATAPAPSRAPARSAAPSCGGQGVVSDNQGLFSFSSPCPACGGRGVTIDDPCPTCRGTGVERRPARGEGAHPRRRRRRPAHPAKGRGGPGQQRRPARRPLRRRARVAAPAVRPQGQRPHPHRADHLPGGGARRRRRGAHPRRRPGHAPDPARHPVGPHLPGEGQGRRHRQGAPATCSSPSRSRCPPSSAPPSARRSRPSKPRRTGPRPARTWGSDDATATTARRAVYVISVAAELAGLHPQTLRIYERKGLVDPARTGGGSRRYSDDDIAQLRRIQELTDRGPQPGRRAAGAGARGRAGRAPHELERPHARPARAAVEQTHRQYRRDLVPLNQSLTIFRDR